MEEPPKLFADFSFFSKTDDELIWFNDKEKNFNTNEKILGASTRAKTKIIASIKKGYDMNFLNNLVNSGINLFRVNCAYFHYKEYKKLLEDLEQIYQNKNVKPTVIFDLKGPIPRISKVGMGKKNFLDVKKDQLIKLVHENSKIEDSDIIHVDKKIAQVVKLGDKILIDSSQCILKVISIGRYRKRNSFNKKSGFRSSEKIQNQLNANDTLDLFDEFYNCEDSNMSKIFFDPKCLDIIEEKEEENNIESDVYHHLDDNVDLSLEERLKQRENNMRKAYQNIIKKHISYSDYDKINQIERMNESAGEVSHMTSLKSTDDENYLVYRKKRQNIRSSISSYNHKCSDNMLLCEVNHAGSIHLHRKVFLLGKEIVTEMDSKTIGVKDIVDLSHSLKLGVNIITALINNATNIEEIKEIAGDVENLKIYARIETSEAIYNFDSILEMSDGIVIQHGLLSTKIPHEDLCLIEMYMIEKCKLKEKPILLQTCILKSMMNRKMPLTTEIANLDSAVNHGIDGIILKEEITFAHNYQEIIQFLKDILLQMELQSDTKNKYEELSKFFKIHRELSADPTIESILDCAVKTVFDMNVSLIILSTDIPKYAKTLSKFRPNCIIICATDDKKVYNHLRLIRGVSPFLYDLKSAESLIIKIVQRAKDRKLISIPYKILVINAFCNKDSIYKNGMYFYDESSN